MLKENKNGERHYVQTHFKYYYPKTTEQMMDCIQSGSLFGVVECDIVVPEDLKAKFADFPPLFKNTLVSREDIGPFMQSIAEEHNLLKKPRKMLLSSYYLKKGMVITPMLIYLLELGLRIETLYSVIEYEPSKCFESFVDEVVEARRNGDTNENSSVVAETMKLIGNSSYGYQIMNRSRHSVTKYGNESSIHDYINSKMFKTFTEVCDDVYEVGMAKKRIEHKEAIVIGFFILQYAKLRMLELYYNFLHTYCDKNLYEEIEMDTDSLYLALGRENIYDCIRPEVHKEWQELRSHDCIENFKACPSRNFFPRNCCDEHVKFDKRTPGLFKEEFRCTEMIALCSKTYSCYCDRTKAVKLSSKGVNKQHLGEPMEKYRKVLFGNGVICSKNRGFRVVNSNSIYTYEQEKRGLSAFYPKRVVLDDGIHTIPLNI